MVKKLSSRWLAALLVIALSIVVVSAACSDDEDASTAKPFEGQTMIATSYSGPFYDAINEVFVKAFEEQTGAKVELVPSTGEEIVQIPAAPADDPPYDAVFLGSNDYLRAKAEGLLAPLRLENIPNAAELTDFHKSPGFGLTPDYGMPFDFGFIALGYDKEDLGFEPTSWKDLWRPEVTGNIAQSADQWIAPASTTALSIDVSPGEGELYTDAGLDAIISRLQEQDVAVWSETGAEMTAAISRGDVDVVVHAAEIIMPLILRNPDKFAMVLPEEGVPGFIDYFGVVRGTKKRDMAEAFVNFMLDAELQSQWAELVPYYMSNKNVEYGPVASEVIPSDPAERASFAILMDWDYIAVNWDTVLERFRKDLYTQ
jgi:spermidine/putrescine transport system substrate-binding protein